MTFAEPIDVVRRVNGAFAAAPFGQVRAVTRDANGFDDGVERLRKLGLVELGSLDDLIGDEVVVGETDIQGAATLTKRWVVREGKVTRYGIISTPEVAAAAVERGTGES